MAGVAGDQRLHGYDGDTGAVVYAGGGANELMTGTRQWKPAWSRAAEFTSAPTTKYMPLAARRNTYAYTYRYGHRHCNA